MAVFIPHHTKEIIFDCEDLNKDILDWLNEINPAPPKPPRHIKDDWGGSWRIFFKAEDIDAAFMFFMKYMKHVSSSNLNLFEAERNEKDRSKQIQ